MTPPDTVAGHTAGIERPDDDVLEPHLPEYIDAAKRCGIQKSDWIPGWYVPWSPRNDNQNAEGPWSHWVALAHEILRIDQEAIAKATAARQSGEDA
jgi:hypothetical protein